MSGATFTEIYLPLRDVIYTVCLSIMRNPQDADDMTQDVYLKLWEIREELNEVVCPKAFVIRTARNKCLDKLKSPARARKNEENASEFTVEADCYSNPFELLVAKEKEQRLTKWVNSLKEPKKSIFILRQYDMLTNQETADRLGLQETTVRSTLSRLRREARDILLFEEK